MAHQAGSVTRPPGQRDIFDLLRGGFDAPAGVLARVHSNEFGQTGRGQHGISIIQQFRTGGGRTYYRSDVVVDGNTVTLPSGDRDRLGTYDDTCGRRAPASLVLGPNELA